MKPNAAPVHANLPVEELVRLCVQEDGGKLADSGAVVAYSGKYTGRTPKDKFTVLRPETEGEIWWDANTAMSPEAFARVDEKVRAHLATRPTYVVDAFAGADPATRIAVRFVVERPYHALFVRQLLIRPTAEELATFEPDWTVMDAATLGMDPAVDPVRGDAVIALDFETKAVRIAGTQYAGELKKSIFTVMNFLLPRQGILGMHCSANVGPDGDVALFFGLSGTGKTTLSADPDRGLIGDDEHGWSDTGVFNVEGGCYAKCIGLTEEKEPEIHRAIRSGAILENVVLHGGVPDYDDASITENTRAAYPLEHIPNAVHPSVGGHPKHVVFLTCDAMGVLPPLARLSKEQAMRWFLTGYTAKVAGTESGVTEPQAVFSACFGQPFLPLPPRRYAALLGEKIDRHGPSVWLVNTGWTGGGYGVGSRMKLSATRAMLRAAFSGALDDVEMRTEPVFGLSVPVEVAGVDSALLDPRATWPTPEGYDEAAAELKALFDAAAAKFA